MSAFKPAPLLVLLATVSPAFAQASLIGTTLASQGPFPSISAAGINPCDHRGKSRLELAEQFPNMPPRELDKLQFRIVETGCPADHLEG